MIESIFVLDSKKIITLLFSSVLIISIKFVFSLLLFVQRQTCLIDKRKEKDDVIKAFGKLITFSTSYFIHFK